MFRISLRHLLRDASPSRCVVRTLVRGAVTSFATALLVQIAVPQSVTAQAAGIRRYRLDSKTEQSINAEAIGGGRQQTQTDRSAFLRVTVKDSAGGKAILVAIDSLLNRGENLPAGTQEVADSARGKVFRTFIAADGTVTPVIHPSGAGALGTAIGGQLDEFFPRAKVGAKVGESWDVVSERPQLVPGGELTVKRSTKYSAMGATTREGVKAARIDLTFTTTATGAMQIGPTNTKVAGSSSGTGSVFVSDAGVYLGGTRSEKTERRLLLEGAPAPVVVTAETATTVTLLR